MGLLGIIFNKWVLRIILIVIGTFIVLQILGSLISFTSRLNQTTLLAAAFFTLSACAVLSMKVERFKFLCGPMKLLFFAFVPSLLILACATSIPVPNPLRILLEVVSVPIPCIVYAAYRKKLWVWTDPASSSRSQRRHRKLTKNDLIPKGIESGHIVFGAGRRGFRVLRFIEFREAPVSQPARQNRARSVHSEIAKIFARGLMANRKLGVEASYEMYRDKGQQRVIVTLICEGRNYRRCRLTVDEFTRILSQDARQSNSTGIYGTQVDDNKNAERILLSPLFATLESLEKIDCHEYNAKLTLNDDELRTIRLRVLRLSCQLPADASNGVDLLGWLLDVALSQNRSGTFACMLYAKGLPYPVLKKELKRTEDAYQSGLAQLIEGATSKSHGNKELVKQLFIRDEKTEYASEAVKEARNRIDRLRNAENSGYFAVSIILIAEPATGENIARELKAEISSCAPHTEFTVDRLPPTILQSVVRRALDSSSEKLNGQELASLIAPERDTAQRRITEDPSDSLNAIDSEITEKAAS